MSRKRPVRRLPKPRHEIKDSISSALAAHSSAGPGQRRKKTGSIFSICLRDVQLSRRQTTMHFHSSGYKSSWIKPQGLRGGCQELLRATNTSYHLHRDITHNLTSLVLKKIHQTSQTTFFVGRPSKLSLPPNLGDCLMRRWL